ncbi:MAG: tripartite tricarboxylate transporter substrate binding protein [Hyphomicrobiales bacterium]|nr:tripartite tricarboxylate transporter substrate binding protein [Hyphomicrobiales bacterium]
MLIRRLRSAALALIVAVLAGWSMPASAQSYPNRPVRVIIAFAAGGSSDVLTRLVVQDMSETLGQPFVIEYRPGAGGNIGADAVAKSPPDGYTLFSGSSSLTLAGSLFSKLSYNPMADFAPITLIGSSPMLVTVNPGFPVRSVAELIALAKQKPGEISYASAGAGSMNHLAVELLKAQTGIDLRHIPYRGNPLAAIDAISGQVPVFFDYVLTGIPHVRDGKLRALATTSARRLAALPDLPTMSEAGVPGFEASLWFALFAPAGTPGEIVDKLNQAALQALAKPRVRERMAELGIEVLAEGPERLAAVMKSDHAKWKSTVEKAGIKLE